MFRTSINLNRYDVPPSITVYQNLPWEGNYGYTVVDMSVTIIIIEGDGATARKKLKEKMPISVREALDSVGRDVEMESGEQMRRKLPEGFPDEFVVPEEILVFPPERGESELSKSGKRRLKSLRNKLVRKTQPGNTEA